MIAELPGLRSSIFASFDQIQVASDFATPDFHSLKTAEKLYGFCGRICGFPKEFMGKGRNGGRFFENRMFACDVRADACPPDHPPVVKDSFPPAPLSALPRGRSAGSRSFSCYQRCERSRSTRQLSQPEANAPETCGFVAIAGLITHAKAMTLSPTVSTRIRPILSRAFRQDCTRRDHCWPHVIAENAGDVGHGRFLSELIVGAFAHRRLQQRGECRATRLQSERATPPAN